MYQNNTNKISKHLDFILWDMVLLLFAFWLAYTIRFGTGQMDLNGYYMQKWCMVGALQLILVGLTHNYKGILYRGYLVELWRVIKHVTLIVFGLVFVSFFQHDASVMSRMVIINFYIYSIIFMYIERVLWKQWVRRSMEHRGGRKVVLAASRAEAEELLQRFQERGVLDFDIRAIILPEPGPEQILGVPVVAYQKDDAMDYIEEHVVDEIIFMNVRSYPSLQELMEQCELMGLTVHVVVRHVSKLVGEQTIEKLAGVSMISSCIKLVTPTDMMKKRFLDILGGLVGTVICGILTVFVGPLIYIADPGPIFFAQPRIGLNGRVFKCYKFRSMYQDAEKRKKELMDKNEMDGFMFKMEHDPRIIGSGPDGTKKGIGWFIRTFSIDEFPQFWNILKGDMSLVGTRPPTLDEWKQYDPHHRIRMRIRPGLTGMWQISGRSDITDFEEVVRLDTEYIRNWSVGLDIKILLKTVLVVLKKEGSK